jgi:hypothetical protein
MGLVCCSDDDTPGLQSRLGIVAGAFITLPLFSKLELQPEVLYSVKGAKLDLDGISDSVVVDYLEVPALVRFSRRGAGKVHYYVAGGPSAGFQLRARTRTKFAGSTEEIDISEQVERFDLGVAFGGGVEIGSIVIDGRYTLGLTDIDKDKTDGIKTTNRVISLTAGFRF